MHRSTLLALATVGVVALSACAGAVEVSTERAEPIRVQPPDDPALTTQPPDDTEPEDAGQSPTTTAPVQPSGDVDPGAINFGLDKPERA